MLILAGVTIATLTGENGILTKAARAKEDTTVAQEKDFINLAYTGCKTNHYDEPGREITAEELQNEIRKNEENTNVTGNGILIVEYTKTGHIYEVTQDGEISQGQKIEDEVGYEGEGTEEKPYLVSSIEDLVYMANIVNQIDGNRKQETTTYAGEYFKLENDLDFNSTLSYIDAERTDFGDINLDGKIEGLKTELTTGRGFPGIGENYYSEDTHDSYSHYFAGSFNGDNHIIRNLYLDDSNWDTCRGLFGYVTGGFELKNLNVHANKVILSCQDSPIVGEIDINDINDKVYIDNCTSSGIIVLVNDSYRVGGIVGAAYSFTNELTETPMLITNCKNFAEFELQNKSEVDKTGQNGGIVGCADHMQIENCQNYADFKVGTYEIGGILGTACDNMIVKNCINYGNILNGVTNNEKSIICIGGVIGCGGSIVESCVNYGEVSGTSDIGGIFGQAQIVTIFDSINYGNISQTLEGKNKEDDGSIGGIAGSVLGGWLNGNRKFGGKIKKCYNLGNINGKMLVGGIVGMNGTENDKKAGSVLNCYNIGNITGEVNYGGIAGLNLVNKSGSIIENSYYLNTSSDVGYTNDDDTTSTEGMKTTEEMKTQSFVDLLNTGLEEKIWKKDTENKNNGYPILNWQ